MLQLFDVNHNKIAGLTNYKEYNIVREINVEDTLTFQFPIEDPKHDLIQEECYIRNSYNEYIIKEVNYSDDDWTEYVCKINIEDIKGEDVSHFETIEQSCTDAVNLALSGTGWTIGGCDVTKLRTVRKNNCSAYDVLTEIQTAYGCEMTFDAINKKVYIYKQMGTDKGAYFAEQLNLKQLKVQRNSYDYVTRLIPIGSNGMDITSVNGGKNYVENYQYSNKILTAYWEDNRYTVAQDLMDDAIVRLDYLSKPLKAYSADVLDLANASEKYKNILDYGLGDTITLLSKRKGVKEQQRIVKTTVYPEEPERNTVQIANKIPSVDYLIVRFQGTSDTVDIVTTTDGSLDGSKVNGLDWSKVQNVSIQTTDIQDAAITTAKIGDAQITSSKIANLAVGTAQIQDASITNAKIASAAIDTANIKTAAIGTAQIQTAAITQALIANASVGTAQIQDAAITGAKIGNAAITAANIVDATITSAKIASLDAGKITTGTLDASKVNVTNLNASNINTGTLSATVIGTGIITASMMAANTITATSGVIANAAITGAMIASATITSANIASATITGANIASATITGANIQNAAITSAQIASATITGANIASATIDGANIKSAAIAGANIKSATITGANIASATITGANIASATITAANIANATITNAQIANGTIGTAQIANGAITTALIGTSAVGTSQIADGSITDAKIVSLTANKITAGTIDASVITVKNLNAANITVGTINGQQIAGNTITGANIAANTVSIDKLINGDYNNYAAWPSKGSANTSPWNSGAVPDTTTYHTAVASFMLGPGKIGIPMKTSIPVMAGDVIYVDFWYKTDSTWNGTTNSTKLRIGDQNDSLLAVWSIGAVATSWTHVTGTYTVGAATTAIQLSLGNDSSVGNVWYDDIVILKQAGTNNIAAGSVTNTLIAASTITGDRLVASTITGDKIAASTITANNIAANTITASQIASGTITAAQIASGTITTAQLASNVGSSLDISSNSSITIKADKTYVDSSVNNIQVGGRNYIQGSDFSGVTPPSGISISNGVATFTSNALQQSLTFTLPMSPDFLNINAGVQLTGSTIYSLTNVVYGTTNPWIGSELVVTYSDGTKGYLDIGGNKYLGSGTIAEFLKTNTYTLKSGVTITSATLTFYMRDATGTVTMSKPKWETGNKSTDWTMAPEDIPTNKNIISTINVSPETVGINASKVSITGSVTLNSWSSSGDATKIDGGQIYTGSITANKLAANTITATSGVIATAAITGAMIASATITSANIQDGTITNADIANATITGAKVASATITNGNIANATITGANIASATITGANIASATITDANIGSLNASKITAGTLDASKVSVTNLNATNITGGTLTLGGTAISISASGATFNDIGAFKINDSTYGSSFDLENSTAVVPSGQPAKPTLTLKNLYLYQAYGYTDSASGISGTGIIKSFQNTLTIENDDANGNLVGSIQLTASFKSGTDDIITSTNNLQVFPKSGNGIIDVIGGIVTTGMATVNELTVNNDAVINTTLNVKGLAQFQTGANCYGELYCSSSVNAVNGVYSNNNNISNSGSGLNPGLWAYASGANLYGMQLWYSGGWWTSIVTAGGASGIAFTKPTSSGAPANQSDFTAFTTIDTSGNISTNGTIRASLDVYAPRFRLSTGYNGISYIAGEPDGSFDFYTQNGSKFEMGGDGRFWYYQNSNGTWHLLAGSAWGA